MKSTQTATTEAVCTLLADFSLEMTGKDVDHLREAAPSIPQGTRINVTYLEHEDLDTRLVAARTARDLGFVPVPHVSARRLASVSQLEEFLAGLESVGANDSIFVVAGDPSVSHGPFNDSLDVIRSGALASHGVRHISVAGYPEGHPEITADVLWSSLEAKAAALREAQIPGDVITQFGFDVDAVLEWIAEARRRGVEMPIRVGVPGPAGVRRLLRYATRFGIGTSAGIAKKYGLSITNLMGTAGPDRFIHALAEQLRPEVHGEVKLHFYTFGGLQATSAWIDEFKENLQ
ncbi:methylenetetrahydrofolate reductase [Nocardioides sp. Kera G14]|uniref:methylenetetrahydrofolate reductase n=1 Tax=Nocardioides sp. Kera G14 TaxID=2884264 RepID=UPI001D111C3D|nr:methylenetetrahydrofolate reductase [Nocardioides sp. Kera G14]UDY23468.1 methylenetetrahydrofolate reductase [Nocardioides sp. Kera G14]